MTKAFDLLGSCPLGCHSHTDCQRSLNEWCESFRREKVREAWAKGLKLHRGTASRQLLTCDALIFSSFTVNPVNPVTELDWVCVPCSSWCDTDSAANKIPSWLLSRNFAVLVVDALSPPSKKSVKKWVRGRETHSLRWNDDISLFRHFKRHFHSLCCKDCIERSLDASKPSKNP